MNRFRLLQFSTAMFFLGPIIALANPVAGTTYTYDLSEADPGTGIFTEAIVDTEDFIAPATPPTVDPSLWAALPGQGILTDGDLGSLLGWDDPNPSATFPNGTFAGFRSDGFGGAPRPKIDIDLGGTYDLNSITLHYLVEDAQFIYAPQPISDGEGGFLFDAFTVSGSTDGANFSELGSTNGFNPIFGPGGDSGSGALDIRTATIDLTGNTASYLSLDLRTPFTFLVLSEYVVDGTLSSPSATPGDYNADGTVDAADYTVYRDNLGGDSSALNGNGSGGTTVVAADYTLWANNFGNTASNSVAVPEPASFILMGFGLLGIFSRRRPVWPQE